MSSQSFLNPVASSGKAKMNGNPKFIFVGLPHPTVPTHHNCSGHHSAATANYFSNFQHPEKDCNCFLNLYKQGVAGRPHTAFKGCKIFTLSSTPTVLCAHWCNGKNVYRTVFSSFDVPRFRLCRGSKWFTLSSSSGTSHRVASFSWIKKVLLQPNDLKNLA